MPATRIVLDDGQAADLVFEHLGGRLLDRVFGGNGDGIGRHDIGDGEGGDLEARGGFPGPDGGGYDALDVAQRDDADASGRG